MAGEETDDISYPHKSRSLAAGSSGATANNRMDPRILPDDGSEKEKGQAVTIFSDYPSDAGVFVYDKETIVDNGVIPIVTASYEVLAQAVPKGYVLYVKEFRTNIISCSSKLNPLLSGVPNVNTRVSLANNANASPFSNSILNEPLAGFVPCYLIGGQNTIIKVRMDVDFSSMPIKPTDLQIITYIRGVALPRNQMPAQYTALEKKKAGAS